MRKEVISIGVVLLFAVETQGLWKCPCRNNISVGIAFSVELMYND